ncbi:MAG: TonB-dependent receptor [Sandarakinorhabdus sp.]|nr:TonB-dependent receptor [Sandarakinorhabdus sp.]
MVKNFASGAQATRHHRRPGRGTLAIAAGALVATLANAAAAQTVAEPGLSNEIIVTARKRSESIQNVPLSIQAFSSEQLAASNISDLSDLAAFAPGLTLFENVDRGYGQVFIRGMQNTPPVGDTSRELASVFIDGIYFTGGVSAINTDNIERVEVIKGPQSALFGRSTFSGAVNFITKTPGNTFRGSARATIKTDNEYEVSGNLEGPIVKDVLTARVSGRFRDFGGQYTNAFNGAPLGEERDFSVSGQLYFTPGERVTAKLTASYLAQNDGPPSSLLVGRKPVHNFTTPSGVTFYEGVVPLTGPIAQNTIPTDPALIKAFPGFAQFDTTPDAARFSFRQSGLRRNFLFTSLDLNIEIADGYNLSYLGGYSDENANRTQDFELSATNNYFLSRRTDSRSYSNELRLASPDTARFRWLVGVYYLHQTLFERDPGAIFGSDIGFFGPLVPGTILVGAGPRVIVDRKIDNYAVFGSLAYDVADNFTLSAEARYQKDTLQDTVSRTTGQTLSGNTKSFLPRFIAQYKASSDLMVYASAAKGLRPTTINSQFAARTEAEKALIRAAYPEAKIDILAPPESIWSFEVGTKGRLADGKLLFGVNAYYSYWKDSQDLQSLIAPIGVNGSPVGTLVTINGTDIKAYGIETDLAWYVTDQFNLGAAFAWNHTELTDKRSNATIARFLLAMPSGQRLAQTPETSGNFYAQYRDALGSGGLSWFGRAEGVYVGTRYASVLNIGETGSSFDLNLRLGLENKQYSATIFVENLLQNKTFESLRQNADCATTAGCSTQGYEAVLPHRRQFGVTLRAKF